MVLFSSDSSSAVASSAAFDSVDESRYTIILAATGWRKMSESEVCFHDRALTNDLDRLYPFHTGKKNHYDLAFVCHVNVYNRDLLLALTLQ